MAKVFVQGTIVNEQFDGKVRAFYVTHGPQRLWLKVDTSKVPTHTLVRTGSKVKAWAIKTANGYEVQEFLFK